MYVGSGHAYTSTMKRGRPGGGEGGVVVGVTVGQVVM